MFFSQYFSFPLSVSFHHCSILIHPSTTHTMRFQLSEDVWHNRTFTLFVSVFNVYLCRWQLKCDGTRAETRFRLSAKRTSPFKSAGASVQSTAVSRGVRISGSNAGYTMFQGSVKSTGYPLHSPVSPSLLHPCVTMCHQVSTGVFNKIVFLSCSKEQACTELTDEPLYFGMLDLPCQRAASISVKEERQFVIRKLCLFFHKRHVN